MSRPAPGSHLAVAVSGNDRWICTGNQDRSVYIWPTRDGQELEMAGYPGEVSRLAFSSGRCIPRGMDKTLSKSYLPSSEGTSSFLIHNVDSPY